MLCRYISLPKINFHFRVATAARLGSVSRPSIDLYTKLHGNIQWIFKLRTIHSNFKITIWRVFVYYNKLLIIKTKMYIFQLIIECKNDFSLILIFKSVSIFHSWQINDIKKLISTLKNTNSFKNQIIFYHVCNNLSTTQTLLCPLICVLLRIRVHIFGCRLLLVH